MRILVVSHFYLAHGGGIERVADAMCRHLAAQGHHIGWAASAADDPPESGTVETIPLPCLNPIEALTGLPMPIPGLRALRRLWRAIGRTDVVAVHDALYFTSLAAMAIAKMRRKPVILVQHVAEVAFASPAMRGVMAMANRIVTRPMLRAADQVVFISDTVRAHFASCRMRRPPLLQLNGVNSELFHPDDNARAKPDLPQSASPLIAFVGRFVEKKGLAIIAEVARLRPDASFALAGAGPIDPSQWQLKNVHLLGALPPDRIAALLRSADCLLLPSVGEGYPLVIQEAMAVGVPVICGEESARADPDASRWLAGVRIDLQDVEGSARRVAEALDGLKTDAEDREAMSRYARERYSWEAFATSIANVAEALVRRNR